MILSIVGNDTLTLADRVILDYADGDNSTLSFPSDIVSIKTGKNKNTIYSRNEQGDNSTLTLRLIRGSSDDKFLQGKLSLVKGDFPSVILINGEFVKRLGDGQGSVTRDVYTLLGGTFSKNVEVKENVEGDTEQAVSVYNLVFAVASRGIA